MHNNSTLHWLNAIIFLRDKYQTGPYPRIPILKSEWVYHFIFKILTRNHFLRPGQLAVWKVFDIVTCYTSILLSIKGVVFLLLYAMKKGAAHILLWAYLQFSPHDNLWCSVLLLLSFCHFGHQSTFHKRPLSLILLGPQSDNIYHHWKNINTGLLLLFDQVLETE